jgi:hypothetical protein
MYFFSRLLFLHEGKIVWEGMTEEFTTTTNPIVQQVTTQFYQCVPHSSFCWNFVPELFNLILGLSFLAFAVCLW